MTPEQLLAIRKRADAATPGPWVDDEDGYLLVSRPLRDAHVAYVHALPPDAVLSNDPDMPPHGAVLSDDSFFWEPADLEFVAAARQDIPALLDEVERLQAAMRNVAFDLRNCSAQGECEHIQEARDTANKAVGRWPI